MIFPPGVDEGPVHPWEAAGFTIESRRRKPASLSGSEQIGSVEARFNGTIEHSPGGPFHTGGVPRVPRRAAALRPSAPHHCHVGVSPG